MRKNLYYEYKTVLLDGLNVSKHYDEVSDMRDKGWVIYVAAPNVTDMKMVYEFKRALESK